MSAFCVPDLRRRALLVGIDRYRGTVPMLVNAVHDVDAVAAVLRERHRYDDLRTLRNDEATRPAIEQSLRDLAAFITDKSLSAISE